MSEFEQTTEPWRRIVTAWFHRDFRKATQPSHNLETHTMHNLFFFSRVGETFGIFFARFVHIASLESVGGGLQIPDSELSLVIGEFVIAFCHYDPGTSRLPLPFHFTSWRREYGSMSWQQ